jgi:hypothetical protein
LDLLVLHPPAVKPASPPLGTAVLLGHLRAAGVAAEAIDANLEAYLHLLAPETLAAAAGPAPATPLRRALRHAPDSLGLLRSPSAAHSFARYQTAVRHLNTALGVYGDEGERLSLGDYEHDALNAFVPADLERLAAGEARTLFRDYFESVLVPRVAAARPRFVALSVNYRHQALPAFELAGLLRRRCPGLVLVGGGGLFTSWQEALRGRDLRFSCYDHLVFGPGEGPLARLAAGETAGYFIEDAAAVAFAPDFDFASPAAYLSPEPVLPLSATRGCYWRRCLFCPEAAAPTHPYTTLAPGDVPALLLGLAARYRVRRFQFTDDALPMPVLRALAARSADLSGLSWHGFVRLESALAEPALAEGLAAAGCSLLQLGVESGSQAVLDLLQKGTRLETVAAILANLKRAGIASYVYIMLGTPGESAADAEQTLAFLEAHADAIGFLNLAIMNLPRDSGLLSDPDAFGIAATALPDGEAAPLSLYRTFTPAGGWGRAEARRFLKERLLASPRLREIVKRTPPLFTSNHAFFFPPP